MTLWQIVLACIFTCVSGAALFVGARGGLFEERERSPFADRSYPAARWPWLRSPVLLTEVALLAAMVAGGIALIVLSR